MQDPYKLKQDQKVGTIHTCVRGFLGTVNVMINKFALQYCERCLNEQ